MNEQTTKKKSGSVNNPFDPSGENILPRVEMMQSEFKATLRHLKKGNARINVPRDIAKNYLNRQLVNVVIEGAVGPVVVL